MENINEKMAYVLGRAHEALIDIEDMLAKKDYVKAEMITHKALAIFKQYIKPTSKENVDCPHGEDRNCGICYPEL